MYDLIIVGGGPAGLSAAHSAVVNGAKSVLVLERDHEAGGILQQCVHNGFGLHHFKQELTGPGYVKKCCDLIKDAPEIAVMTDTMALEVRDEKRDAPSTRLTVTAINPQRGVMTLDAKTVVLTMGCRERTRGAIRIPGTRPAGVFTAGAAQRMTNMEGYIPGHKIVILGSGDIGLIMARRMSLEGCQVKAVLEICPYSNGLARNLKQCLDDFDIPLMLSHTIVAIKGKNRVEGIVAAKVDEHMTPIPGTEFDIDCDTVLLSVGLIPENELSRELGVQMAPKTNGPLVDQHRETSVPGVFAAGNVVHVHDLVDFVSDEAEIAGKFAALEALGKSLPPTRDLAVTVGNGIGPCVPQHLRLPDAGEPVRLFLRVTRPFKNVRLLIKSGDDVVLNKALRVAKPSEMIAQDLPPELVAKLRADLNVAIVEEA